MSDRQDPSHVQGPENASQTEADTEPLTVAQPAEAAVSAETGDAAAAEPAASAPAKPISAVTSRKWIVRPSRGAFFL